MKILDCTIRDGGYYTNWDFSDQVVNTYLKAFNDLPVEYLEVGYRSKQLEGYLGKYFYCPVPVLKELKAQSNKKLVIILNEKDVRAEDAEELLLPVKDYITMVRMAIDPKNFKRALILAKKVKELGFEVAFNVMYMSTWKDEKDFLGLIPKVDGVVDYFYMVDSFGGVYPEDVKETIALVRSKTNVKLGFHGHNNLEMALANTLVAIEEGVDIVDATITGMGRGAGNLKTELLLTTLQAKGKVDFDYNELSKVVDSFSQLQKKYEWGTNLPYMVSGANSLPQKQVMEWVSKRYYSFNSIIRALNNQSQGKEDNLTLPKLTTNDTKYQSALIVGGGPSPVEHSAAIDQFLIQNPDVLVIHASSKNALSFTEVPNEQIFCLVGNEGHRMEEVFGERKIEGKCILPPFPRKMGTYIPKALENNAFELKEVSFTEEFKDSHTAIALQTVLDIGLKRVYLVGYDGYSKDISQKEQELFIENEYMFSKVKEDVELISLTLTNYTVLQKSVYAFLNE
ncbi:aldolase catalytic domain-containing protein [Nonlabens sp.]|uniref:aldolase catalytic domain-containing protein n=1 Tax=Nonlabens sp. TaxID=1888209 RepID=UPI001BCBDFEA|nr:aldolase catalytic domain-containing protein [Nonlabens sp.]